LGFSAWACAFPAVLVFPAGAFTVGVATCPLAVLWSGVLLV